jgi:hypothetical protein
MPTRRIFRTILPLICAALLLSACAGAEVEAVRTVNQYLRGLVHQDSNQVSNLSCKDWEPQALLEVDSLQLVKAELEDVTCAAVGRDAAGVMVQCSGAIVTSYNNESTRIALDGRRYYVTNENGDWFLCGYR